MKSFIKELLFDKEIVNQLQETNNNQDRLYSLLYAGKITLQEYLEATI